MPVSADTLAILISKGLSGTDLVEVVRAIDEDGANAEPVRTLRQARNHRYYENKKGREANKQSETVLIKTSESDAQSAPPSPQRDNNQTPHPPLKSSLRSERSSNAETILATVLCDETVVDLMAHRKAIKATITPGSAKALVKRFAEYGDPEGAAKAMMANGWRGFEPHWMANQQQARAGPVSRSADGLDEARRIIRERRNGRDHKQGTGAATGDTGDHQAHDSHAQSARGGRHDEDWRGPQLDLVAERTH